MQTISRTFSSFVLLVTVAGSSVVSADSAVKNAPGRKFTERITHTYKDLALSNRQVEQCNDSANSLVAQSPKLTTVAEATAVCLATAAGGTVPGQEACAQTPGCENYTRAVRHCSRFAQYWCGEDPEGWNAFGEQNCGMEMCSSGDYDAACAQAASLCEASLPANMDAECRTKCGSKPCNQMPGAEVKCDPCTGQSFPCPIQQLK